mgnify:CR=1 FL=1
MYFLHSVILAAAAAALAPVVLHFLYRQRARTDSLPTVRFLAAGFAANRRRIRLKNLLVLFLRVLAILLIVAALARPAYKGALFFRKGTAPVSAVVVIDNSASMAYEEAGRKNIDRAKALAREIINTLPPGSRVALVVTGLGTRGESLDREFTFNRASIEGAVGTLDISAYGGECSKALSRAYAMSAQDDGGENGLAGREVYVISDLMANSWKGLDGLTPGEDTATLVLDAGVARSEDFYIGDVSATLVTKAAEHAAIKVSVGGKALAAKRVVEAHIEGAKRAEALVDVPAESVREAEFDVPLLFSSSGERQGWVTLADSDPLLSDNTRYFTLPATKPVSCLLVAGTDAAGGGYYIRNALEPEALAGKTQARVTAADGVTAEKLALSDAVIITGGVNLDKSEIAAVRDFVAGGGGIVIFAGGKSAAGARGLIADVFGLTVAGEGQTKAGGAERLSVISYDSPVFAAFSGGRNGNVAAARFYSWGRFKDAGTEAKAEAAARLDGGDALFYTAVMGSGRAVLAAFDVERTATDLVLRAPFVPLVNEMVRYAARAAAGSQRAENYTVGSAVAFVMKQSAVEQRAEIATPLGGRPVEVKVPPGATGFSYRAFFPGNYVCRFTQGDAKAARGFSVNLPVEESASARVEAKEITGAIEGAVVSDNLTRADVRRAWGQTRGARELYDIFIVAAVAILALEAYVANRFYADVKV